MPRNPNKAACTVPECRAWAVRGSNPPLCSSHVGRAREGTRGAGAAGRQNARSHGFYGPALDLTELADLAAYADDLTLDDEIACTRVLLRRLMAQIRALPGEYSSPEEGNPKSKIQNPKSDYARLAGLALQAARTVACLLRDKRALGGDAADGLLGAIGQVLDELSTEWGVEL